MTIYNNNEKALKGFKCSTLYWQEHIANVKGKNSCPHKKESDYL